MYFIFIDSFRRNLPHLFSSPVLGPFLLSGESNDCAVRVILPINIRYRCDIVDFCPFAKNIIQYMQVSINCCCSSSCSLDCLKFTAINSFHITKQCSVICDIFLFVGTAATLAWWLVWPIENMKSQVQGNFGK